MLSDTPESRWHKIYLAKMARKASEAEAEATMTAEPGDGEEETGRSDVDEVDALGAVEEDLGEMDQNEAIAVESREPGEKGGGSEELKRKEGEVAERQAGGRPSREESSKGKGKDADKGDGTTPQPSAVADGLALPLADAISRVGL